MPLPKPALSAQLQFQNEKENLGEALVKGSWAAVSFLPSLALNLLSAESRPQVLWNSRMEKKGGGAMPGTSVGNKGNGRAGILENDLSGQNQVRETQAYQKEETGKVAGCTGGEAKGTGAKGLTSDFLS